MKKQRSGFTILETALFIGVSSLLLVVLTAGLTTNLARGRYNAAISSFADFLRNTYANMLNTEITRYGQEGARYHCTYNAANVPGVHTETTDNPNVTNPGRTNCAVYGKLIVFGNNEAEDENRDKRVYVFDVIGDAVDLNSQVGDTAVYLDQSNYTILQQLNEVHADYLAFTSSTGNMDTCSITPAAGYSFYDTDWGTQIMTAPDPDDLDTDTLQPFIGMVLIARSPVNGEVATYYKKTTTRTNLRNIIDTSSVTTSNCGGLADPDQGLVTDSNILKLVDETHPENSFQQGDLDFCITQLTDFRMRNFRTDVRILNNGQNATAIRTVGDDEEDNACHASF